MPGSQPPAEADMGNPVQLRLSELRVPMKMTFRHASAARKEGESVWAEASRGGVRGYGEGCPRPYVTGETADSCRAWLGEHLAQIQAACTSPQDLRRWVDDNAVAIDRSPSMWCAVEGALLDLFAREQDLSVETLLGRPPPGGPHVYSAVLGNDEPWKTQFLIDQYLIMGLSDFKVKLSGDPAEDRMKLDSIEALAAEHGIPGVRVRLDANNLWADSTQAAIDYLMPLKGRFFAIEEPTAPRDVAAHSRISVALGMPVILDESLCTIADLERYDGLAGEFIANLKVSRVGGVLRALRLVEALVARGWPVIVGAHVGETSVLTRAAMLVARAAGERLIAQEGAFGGRIIEREPARPSLQWGHGGMLDLAQPYAEVSHQGLKMTMPEAWQRGWGLDCRMPGQRPPGDEQVLTQAMSDGYRVHYRLWGPAEGEDVLVVLHGGMSHSGWQAPLAQALRRRSPISVFAPDRRGCGLNAGHGDLGSAERSIEDVIEHLLMLQGRFRRVHLAGWCQGGQYAAVAAARLQQRGDPVSKLLLITPGLFWNDRFRSVIDATERVVQELIDGFGLAPQRDDAFAPVPLLATDFTSDDDWLDFIDHDELRTRHLTLKSVVIMDEVQEQSWLAILQITSPVFLLTARGDRIVDNRKVLQYTAPLLGASPANQVEEMDCGHAVQFEMPEALAGSLLDFIHARAAADAALSPGRGFATARPGRPGP
jgi:L-alanine-DL-glutamate epimerase-like enolase superfamily enzyme/pimeloyl-ACP methyl ester carboxylesterase